VFPLKGVIMAGGLGSRLRPLTLQRPKPMVEVIGIPVINFVKDALTCAGISEVIVTTGYKGETLSSLVESWNEEGLKAWVNEEDVPMGTAGSVRLLKNELKDTFIVGSGDTLASFDIASLLKEHKESGAVATMALWEVEDPSEYGIVGMAQELDGELDAGLRNGWIIKFLEKPTPEQAFSKVINAGLYILEPEVLELIPESEKFDWSRQVFPAMLEKGMALRGSTISGIWFDIGRPSDLLKAQRVILDEQEQLWTQLPLGDGSGGGFISPNANIEGESVDSVILENCHIMTSAVVKDSLMMASSIVAHGCSITSSIIGSGSVVEEGACLDDCVIGDGMVVPASSDWQGIKFPDAMNE
jgi:mannose-1-phosphate guanylyltransferase